MNLVPYIKTNRKRPYKRKPKPKPVVVKYTTGFSVTEKLVLFQDIVHIKTITQSKRLKIYEKQYTEDDTKVTGKLKVFSLLKYHYKNTKTSIPKEQISDMSDDADINIRCLFNKEEHKVIPLSSEDTDYVHRIYSYRNDLYRYALKLTFSTDDADDLTQDVIYQSLKCRHLYINDNNLLGWLMFMLKNMFINKYRKSNRVQMVHATDEYDPFYDCDKPIETTNSFIYTKEIHEAISELEDDYKIPFMMHVDGYKYVEIAEQLAVPLGTIKSRIWYARKLLQESLVDFL